MSSWGEIVLRACFRPLDEQVAAFRREAWEAGS